MGGSGAYDMKERLGFQLADNTRLAFASRNFLLHKLGSGRRLARRARRDGGI